MHLLNSPLSRLVPSALRTFEYRGNFILGEEGGTAVARALRHVPQLRKLDLSCALAIARPALGGGLRAYRLLPARLIMRVPLPLFFPSPRLTCSASRHNALCYEGEGSDADSAQFTEGVTALADALCHLPELRELNLGCARRAARGWAAARAHWSRVCVICQSALLSVRRPICLSCRLRPSSSPSVRACLGPVWCARSYTTLEYVRNTVVKGKLVQALRHLPQLQILNLGCALVGASRHPLRVRARASGVCPSALLPLPCAASCRVRPSLRPPHPPSIHVGVPPIPSPAYSTCRGNHLRADGVMAVAQVLRHLPQLQALNLGYAPASVWREGCGRPASIARARARAWLCAHRLPTPSRSALGSPPRPARPRGALRPSLLLIPLHSHPSSPRAGPTA